MRDVLRVTRSRQCAAANQKRDGPGVCLFVLFVFQRASFDLETSYIASIIRVTVFPRKDTSTGKTAKCVAEKGKRSIDGDFATRRSRDEHRNDFNRSQPPRSPNLQIRSTRRTSRAPFLSVHAFFPIIDLLSGKCSLSSFFPTKFLPFQHNERVASVVVA